jgi:hypothetical protein
MVDLIIFWLAFRFIAMVCSLAWAIITLPFRLMFYGFDSWTARRHFRRAVTRANLWVPAPPRRRSTHGRASLGKE